jgi:hypothetical protein
MKTDHKKITWDNVDVYLTNITPVDNMPDYSKDPYFVNKAQKAKDWYDKHGWPEDDHDKKD